MKPEWESAPARDDWFVTASGRIAYVLAPEKTEIRIEDIAHALSNVCRFGGHTQTFYSVAQHSVLVSELVPSEHAMVGLLHDSAEAYLGDVIRPLKRALPEYRYVEDLWWKVIARKFGLPEEVPACVKLADRIALETERRDLVMAHPWLGQKVAADHRQIYPLEPRMARGAFLDRFRDLGGRS